MSQVEFRRDDTVYLLDPATYPDPSPSVKYPGEWKVEKVNQRTLGLIQGERRLKADRALVTHTRPIGVPSAAGTSETIDYRTPFVQGQIVRWQGGQAKAGQTLFVVISDDGGPTITRMVPLGNATGRYWRKVPARAVELVELKDILAEGVTP